MDPKKDYYAILGVHPTAEIAVIEAAYKALAKRYHPDMNQGNPEGAKRRMQEINEAYEVLSNKSKRKEYDKFKGSGTQEGDDYFRGEDEKEPEYDPLEEDWQVALEYFPELRQYFIKLSRISWKLGYSFKAFIVETKEYDASKSIYHKMRHEFIARYFGTNKSILEFANYLIDKEKKEPLKELNKVVTVLGIDQSFSKTNEVINKIEKEYKVRKYYEPLKKETSSFYKEPKEESNQEQDYGNYIGGFFLGIIIIVIILIILTV